MIPFGYFTTADALKPAVDPGVEGVLCPACNKPLTDADLRTISLREENSSFSLFYRLHRTCHQKMTREEQVALDTRVLDQLREVGIA